MTTTQPLQVFSDHALEVGLQGASSIVVKVVGGGTVYYADQPYVTSSSNQGSITNGSSQTFTVGQWIVSASQSAITVATQGGSVSDVVLGTDGLVGGPSGSALTAGTTDVSGTYPALTVAKVNGTSVPATPTAAQTIVASSGTAAAWAYPTGYEWSYTQITSAANVTDTAEATATALISPSAFTPDGAAVYVEFFSPFVGSPSTSAGTVTVTLFEGATQIGRFGTIKTPAAAVTDVPVLAKFKFTPTNAAHTYKLCAFASSTTGTPVIDAGASGTNGDPPAYVRFVKA